MGVCVCRQSAYLNDENLFGCTLVECIGDYVQMEIFFNQILNQRVQLHRIRNANASFNMQRIFLNYEIDKVIMNAKHLIDFRGKFIKSDYADGIQQFAQQKRIKYMLGISTGFILKLHYQTLKLSSPRSDCQSVQVKWAVGLVIDSLPHSSHLFCIHFIAIH